MYTLEMARAHIQELHEMAERSRPVGPRPTLTRVKKFVARATGR
ncbi:MULTISPECIES: hypothetical protein [Streptomycetaceae]|uniref:Uncharacterized protein n=1 Tax=Streptodolium elevatio TaxID=3157996 RepID=A0ABV3DTM4_9ACTN|nr:hypothetical protein [Yinghuangia soli]